jgi:hypothetical protein
MTRDEIIKMATQAGWQMPIEWDSTDGFLCRLERFAALVAEAEREACAMICEEEAADFEQMGDGCSDGRYDWKADGCMDCAANIRAREPK